MSELRGLFGFVILPPERGAAHKLFQRAIFELPHPLASEAGDLRDLFERVCAFVGDTERAIARWLQAVFSGLAMCQMVAALGL